MTLDALRSASGTMGGKRALAAALAGLERDPDGAAAGALAVLIAMTVAEFLGHPPRHPRIAAEDPV